MSIKKTEFKIELILLICFMFLLLRALPEVNREKAVSEEQTEQTEAGMLVVEYATGDDLLLAKEAGIVIDAPKEVPRAFPSITHVPVADGSVSVAEVAGKRYTMEELSDITYLKENLYIVNASTKMTEEEFDECFHPERMV